MAVHYERDGKRVVLVCTCAAKPPTMPTCRQHHLPDCPCSPYYPADTIVIDDPKVAARIGEIRGLSTT